MNNFYKGYIRTKNKIPMQKVVNGNLLSLSEAQKYDEFAGVLADDAVVIDLDDRSEYLKLLDIVDDLGVICQVIETSKGGHFIFKNTDKRFKKNVINRPSAIGLTIDVKAGMNNGIEVLKSNGKMRDIVYDKMDDEEYDEAPFWLLPIKSCRNFMNMTSGDGRNDALFSHILQMRQGGLTVTECKQTIDLINNYLFQDKMDRSEIDKICREESFAKPVFFGEKGAFLFNIFGDYIREKYHIVKINDAIHHFNGQIYVFGRTKLEKIMLDEIPTLKEKDRIEVTKYLYVVIDKNIKECPPDYIAFANGVYDVKANKLNSFSPDYIVTSQIPWNYNPDAESEIISAILDNLATNDGEIRKLLEELVGYCFYNSNNLASAFIIKGSASNGKSTFLKLLSALIGDDNVTNLDLSELSSRFSPALLFNKRVNIGADIDNAYLQTTGNFKNIVTGDAIKAEYKMRDGFMFKPTVKLIYACNNLPRIGNGEDSEAIMRRLQIIPFNAKFTPGTADFKMNIVDELITDENMEYLARIGIEALKRLLENQQFTHSEAVELAKNEYYNQLDPLLDFFVENPSEAISGRTTDEVYSIYKQYANNNGVKEITKTKLSQAISKKYGLKTTVAKIKDKSKRIYT